MIARAERPLAPHKLLQAARRHKSRIFLWYGLMLGVSIATLTLLPRKYESEAKLFLRLGRESVTLDPTATTGTTMQVQESRENQINSTRDMLKSRALLDCIVEKIGPETILNGPPGASPRGTGGLLPICSNILSSLSISPFVSPSERAVNKLLKSIDVTLGRNSSVINIECTAQTPGLAQEILQAFLEAYQEQHLAANRTAGSLEFFDAQVKQLKHRLDAAIDELRDAKNESGIVSIVVEQQALQNQLMQVEAASLEADAALASTKSSIASLRKSVQELPEKLTTQQTGGFPNVAADSMRQELFKLQMAVREQQTRLGDEHPLTKLTREQARKLEETVNALAVDRTQTTTGINASRESLALELRRAEALAESLQAKGTTLKEQYASLQQRMRTLNKHEVPIAELERQTAIAEATYRNYADHLEQARVVEALEARRISNVNVVQPPSLVETPVSPRPLLILGLGFLTAVLGSLGLLYGSEYFDDSLKSAGTFDSDSNGHALETMPSSPNDQALVDH